MFGIPTDPTSFWNWQVLSRANIVSFLALIAWILPFSGIVPPATLTVDAVPNSQVNNMAFGVPNWNIVNPITPAIINVATVPSDVMLKIAWQTAERSQILPITAPAVNSLFGLSFFGPTMRCVPPNDAQKMAFDYYVARIRNESSLYVAADISDVDNVVQNDPTAPILDLVYSAFSPRFSETLNDPSVDATYTSWRPELGSFNPSDPLRPGVLQHALLQELCAPSGADATTIFFPEVEPYFCRNGSLARAIEDLANNITISLLSNQQLPWVSSVDDIDNTSLANQGVLVPITITTFINLYTYDWRNVVIPYIVAAAFALGAVFLGGLAFRQNSVNHISSFSTLVGTTRNPDLDALTQSQCLGAVPLSEDVGRTKSRFGMVGPTTEKARHAAFGLDNSVQTLQKAIECS